MNIIKIDNKVYKYESLWRSSKNDKTTDFNNTILPYPISGKPWHLQDVFLKRLIAVQKVIPFIKYSNPEITNCLLCDKKKVNTGVYQFGNVRWESGLQHYIEVHNIKPSEKFMDLIFGYDDNIKKEYISRIPGVMVVKDNLKYLKLTRNNIFIMDALMEHGSKKQYKFADDRVFSEHAGLLDFKKQGLKRILISTNTDRIDPNDNEIFLPNRISDIHEYEYVFHTHPATPTPGARAYYGILYEFPSVSDLLHFIHHYNEGETQGSIVVAPEGMYIIRKNKFDDKPLKIDIDKLIEEISDKMIVIQEKAIKKYGTKISLDVFYNKISQDKTYVDTLNKYLKKYDLVIDYYARIKDESGNWIIDTLYLPVYVIETK